MTIQKIYDKYKIMPQLQEHMLRVAAVATLVCDSFEKEISEDLIVAACLLHDMGNMVKIKLDRFPEFLEPKGYDYWKKVQDEFLEKYGTNDYKATYKILKELELEKKVFDFVKSIEFAKAPQIEKDRNYSVKICLYSDMRVTPFGIASIDKRLSEVKNRYIKNKGVTEEFFDSPVQSVKSIEKQIFSKCKIGPEDITEEKVKPLINDLRNFQIKTK